MASNYIFLWFFLVLSTIVLSSVRKINILQYKCYKFQNTFSHFQRHFDSIHKQFICIIHSNLLVESFNCSHKKVNWMKSIYNIDARLKPGVQINNAYVSVFICK